MKAIGRHHWTALFGGAALAAAVTFGMAAGAQDGSFAPTVTEGESIDQIKIGESTENDVIAYYGPDYKLVKHKEYSFEMIYKNLGLAFYYCAADPNREIFVVEVEPPSRAKTAKGIVLGESSFADVLRLYGGENVDSDEAEYEGVSFFAEIDDTEEDGDDARYTVQSVEASTATTSETRIELNDALKISGRKVASSDEDFSNSYFDNSNRITDGDEIRTDDEDEEESENEAETAATKAAPADEEKKAKTKVVKRIELFEKSGLRQCDTKFPGK